MPRPDEGLIHAWLDGQLPPEEAARIEELVTTDPEWASAVAEARGLVAASSRILSALDRVPAGVVPKSAPAHTGQRLPWWTKIAAAVVVVVGGSVVVMQNTPEGRVPGLRTRTGSTQPTRDTQKVAGEGPAVAPPVPETKNPGTTARKPAASTARIPAGAVIGSEDSPVLRREALAPQPVATPAAPVPSAKAMVAIEQKAVPDAERVVAELSAPQSLAVKGMPSATQSVAPSAASQAQQASTQDLARAQNAAPGQRGLGGVVALRSAQEQQTSLCYRLVPDRARGPVSIMRAVRMTGDTLYLASLESNPLHRAWLVLRDGMKGVMTTDGDQRSAVRVVATPTACPAR